MNDSSLIPHVLVPSIILIMSVEELFSNGHFNGPVFDPNSISWDVDSINCICNCCDGCTK